LHKSGRLSLDQLALVETLGIGAHAVRRSGLLPGEEVLVIGAGVAGLQAIATARRLGAVVSGYDVRAAVNEQIESLGAKFVSITIGASGEGQGGYARALTEEEIHSQREQMAAVLKEQDVVITTAAVPGRKV
jgi:NAD(P) transhydrogenase subunit alpha